MKTKTNLPSQIALAITVALAITLMAVMIVLAQLRVDREQHPDLQIHGSSDQTIMPTAAPQAPPR
jgi:hypothetical protein